MPAETAGAPSVPVGGALGSRIRARRLDSGVTLRELARRLNVSASLLSQIERGRAQPSVGTLWALVSELGLSLDALFSGPGEPEPVRGTRVLRAGQRSAIELDGGVRWERLTAAPDPDVDFAFVTYPPDVGSPGRPTATHHGREYGFVVSGRLRLEIGPDSYTLAAGDSIVFESQIPHRFSAAGPEPARAVWWNLDPKG